MGLLVFDELGLLFLIMDGWCPPRTLSKAKTKFKI